MSVMVWVIILLLIPVVLILWGIGVYNRLIAAKNAVDASWGQIDVQLKRRFDLVPNLVEIVKGYAGHEKGILDQLTEARAKMVSGDVQQRAEGDNMLTGALKSVFALSEAYPDLKANTNFQELQQELSQTEDSVARSRELYNQAVMEYNTLGQSFPASMIAGMTGFSQRPYYPIDEEHREPVKVSFSS